MIKRIHGIVYGKTIRIEEDLGLEDGAKVDMMVEVTEAESKSWGEGIRSSAGAAAELPGFDEVFVEIEHSRKSARFRDLDG